MGKRISQAAVKLAFVEKYCSPKKGRLLFVDLDGQERKNAGKDCLDKIHAADAKLKFSEFKKRWAEAFDGYSVPEYRRYDVLAVHGRGRSRSPRAVVAEVEVVGSLQPEQKVYSAFSQLLRSMARMQAKGVEIQAEYFLVIAGQDNVFRTPMEKVARELVESLASIRGNGRGSLIRVLSFSSGKFMELKG